MPCLSRHSQNTSVLKGERVNGEDPKQKRKERLDFHRLITKVQYGHFETV